MEYSYQTRQQQQTQFSPRRHKAQNQDQTDQKHYKKDMMMSTPRAPQHQDPVSPTKSSSSPYFNGKTTKGRSGTTAISSNSNGVNGHKSASPNNFTSTTSNKDISSMKTSSTAHFRHLSSTAGSSTSSNGSSGSPDLHSSNDKNNLFIPGVSNSTEDVTGKFRVTLY